jgi:uncharacterized tellurite resistance protein B-like protein
MAKGNEEPTMFGSLRTFISKLVEDSGSPNQFQHKARLATASLLIRVATVDSEMTEVKRTRLHDVLKSGFGLDDVTTVQLIDHAVTAERSAIDLYQFTRQINEALDDEGRRRVIQMMWEVIYVDGSVNGFEANVIWRTADLLGVSSRQRIEMRQQIAACRSVLAPS